MKTEYDDDPRPLRPGEKHTKAERRAIATRKARQITCTQCGHPSPDHTPLAGIERGHLVWCDVCDEKCLKEKAHA